ncbi:MAG: hypothetical protein ACYDA4_16630 [Ignavibacteriaceae bacterium]
MSPIDDETLNLYIDGELDQTKLKDIKEQLIHSEIDRKRLEYLQKVHGNLLQLNGYQTSTNFTSFVMSRLEKKIKASKKDKIFILSMFSVFMIFCLAIAGYLLFSLISDPSSTGIIVEKTDSYISIFIQFIESTNGIFSPQNISIFGSIISFGFLAAAYFIYEEHKLFKRKIEQ